MGMDLRNPPTTDEGTQYVSILAGKSGRRMVIHGIKFDVPIDQTIDDDHTYPETREIQGAWLEVAGHEPGDYIEISLRGIIEGEEIELGKFGETIFIPPSGKIEQVNSEATVSFPAGFKLRMTYFAVNAGGTRTVYGWYRMRK